MALPNLLDAIDHLRLGVLTLSDEAKPPEEQQDLLESFTVKEVPKPSNTKDAYQKFMNILDMRPCVRDPAPTLKPGDPSSIPTMGDPPIPPGWVDPPPTPGQGNPPPNSGAPSGSHWEPGKIPTDKEEPKKLFSYRNPLYNKPSAPPPKVSDPIPPIPHKKPRTGEGEPMAPPVHTGDTPVNHSQGDLSLNKMSKQEASSQEVAKPTKCTLCPSKLPRRNLKYTDGQCTIFDPQGCPIGGLQLTDIAKSRKNSASGSGAAKHKEPDTPDLGSGGASAPVQKQVKLKEATYHHGSAPGIHKGASLHDVQERDEDDDNGDGEGEEDNDDTPGETHKDEYEEEKDDDDDDTQFINTNPIPSKHWTQSQQAQQDKKESSLVKEILSDDEKQQKSWMEVQKASKESASPFEGQLGSQGEGSGSISGESDLQDPVNEGGEEVAVKEVFFTKLNTKDRVLMKALSEAWDQCYEADNLSAQKVQGVIMGLDNIPTAVQIHKQELFNLGSLGNRIVDDINSHWESYLHKYGVLADAPYS